MLRQHQEQNPFLDNCYPEVVKPEGNLLAKQTLNKVMSVDDANWRGIGQIPASGFSLKSDYADHNARQKFTFLDKAQRKRAGEMPAGCDCARVVLGKVYPDQCRLYGRGCNPRNPVGPCMVSDEGACRIWWSHGVHQPARKASA